MATSNDIKKGLCIEFSNDIYKVIEREKNQQNIDQ